MKKFIYVIKMFLGIIAVWQVIGIIPVLTWIPRLNEVTANMLAVVFIKVVVMFICGGLYYWIGRQQQKNPDYGSGENEFRNIGIAILGLVVLGVFMSVVLPVFVESQPKKASSETQYGSENSFSHEESSNSLKNSNKPKAEETQNEKIHAQIAPQLLAIDAGVEINVKGLSPNGEMLVEINNASGSEVKNIGITLINSQQHLDFINGHSTVPAYTESYSAEVSVSPNNMVSINIPVKWDFQTNYLVSTVAYGMPLSNSHE